MVKLERLKYWRERAPLTQEELAKKANVRRQTIIAIEAGGEPRPDTTRRLAAALGVQPQQLMGNDEDGGD